MNPAARPQLQNLSAKDLRFGIVASRFNEKVVNGLREGALSTLSKRGADPDSIKTIWVPGALEIPLIAKKMAESGQYDAIICLGAVIKGDTAHFEFISQQTVAGIGTVSLETGIPCSLGVLTCYTPEQAVLRSSPGDENKGIEAALAAIEMAQLLKDI